MEMFLWGRKRRFNPPDIASTRQAIRAKRARPLSADSSNSTPLYRFLLVVDFEATCNNTTSYKQEIIEFPIVLVDTEKKEVVDQFHAYVRPVINKTLTYYCRNLTGITQDTVDAAEVFEKVLDQVQAWMEEKKLLPVNHENSFAIVADSPFDIAGFLYDQCQYSRLEFPSWAQRWVNISHSFKDFYEPYADVGYKSMKLMLEALDEPFEGRQHSGIDDAKNIAKIALTLLKDGARLTANESLATARNYVVRRNLVPRRR